VNDTRTRQGSSRYRAAPAAAHRPVHRTARVRRRQDHRPPASRLVALLVAMILGFGAILGRLIVLQVRDASAYSELARDQRVREVELPATRGSILDRTGRPLALSLPAKGIFADPALVEDPEGTSRAVAKALGASRAQILHRIRSATGRFVYIARGVDLEKALAVQKLQLRGIGFLDESRRHYPARNLAPQVLGFTGVDGDGLAGLEAQYQELLAGRPGHQRLEVAARPPGTLIPQAGEQGVAPVPGRDLVLTIDADLQFQVQKLLAAAVKENQAKGGTVIVVGPATGEILAMASYPWFDPNRFGSAPAERYRNPAVADVYEPGSANKLVVAAAALEEGLVTARDTLRIPDTLKAYTKRFSDAHRHEPQSMTLGDIIAQSSNIGAIKVARMLKENYLYSYLQKFGLGRRTGLSFPGESVGILPPPEEWSGVSLETIAIGQGVAVTPLQMAMAYATVANGGVWVPPRLVKGSADAGGRLEEVGGTGESRRVVSRRTARSVAQMLGYAVDYGTGRRAQIPDFWVAGKTGTARKPLEGQAAYSDKYVASFMGFVPAARPSLVVAAMLDEPVTEYGAIAAAPLFQQVARHALTRMRIAPAPRLPLPPHAIPLPPK
jgi:cell division protein FtsI (penicillin-binding protein 3)